MPEEEPIVALVANYCIDYMDEFILTLTSFGPTPNRVRQYLRKRFVYSLAEVLRVQIPINLLSSIFEEEAYRILEELESLGAEARVRCKLGGPESESYPEVRLPLVYQVE